MRDYFVANGINSLKDLDLYISNHVLDPPVKRTIKQTLPFVQGSIDFSDFSGEIIFEERNLKYTIDVAELTLQEVEQKKQEIFNKFAVLPSNIKIEDTYLPNYYFIGTFNNIEQNSDQEQVELSINFSIYPFLFSKNTKNFEKEIVETEIISIENNSVHPITVDITCDQNINIKNNNVIYSFSPGTYQNSGFVLYPGKNDLEVIVNAPTNLKINFVEEVL